MNITLCFGTAPCLVCGPKYELLKEELLSTKMYELTQSSFEADIAILYFCDINSKIVIDGIMTHWNIIKKNNPWCKIIIGGCVQKDDFMKKYPFVDKIVSEDVTTEDMCTLLASFQINEERSNFRRCSDEEEE